MRRRMGERKARFARQARPKQQLFRQDHARRQQSRQQRTSDADKVSEGKPGAPDSWGLEGEAY